MGILDALLPDGWEWGRVGDAFQVTRKPRGLSLDHRGGAVFVPMDAVPQDGSYSPRYETRAIADLTSGTYFERGNLLVAKITPSFENGKQAIVANCPDSFGFATTEVIPLNPKDATHDLRLLFFFLLHPDVRSYIAERMEGSTARQRVPEQVLLDLPFPIIPSGEQKALADAIESISRGGRREKHLVDVTKELKKSAMDRLFTLGACDEPTHETSVGTLPVSWTVCRLAEYFSVASGGTPLRTVSEYWENGTIPWVKTGEINYSLIHHTEEHITPAGLAGSSAKRFPAGTLMMAMFGQGVTRGRVAFLGIEATCNQACAAIQPTNTAVDIRFLYYFLTWRYEAIRSLAHGGQQQNLNLEIIRNMPIAFPPSRDDQNRIVSILDSVDRKQDLHLRKAAVLDGLFDALLHELMTGIIRVSDLDLTVIDAASLLVEASS
jgi:type I restriction enzyme, S subunit